MPMPSHSMLCCMASLMTTTPSDASADEMVAGDIATAKKFGQRLAAAVVKFGG